MNLNKVFILGRVTADPETRTTTSGERVTSFSIATNRVWTDKSGQKKEASEFHNVVFFGRQADVASQFLSKGSLVLVEGRLQTRSYEAKDGTKRYVTEIMGESLQLGPRSTNAGGGNFEKPSSGNSNFGSAPKTGGKEDVPVIEIEDDILDIRPEDLPF